MCSTLLQEMKTLSQEQKTAMDQVLTERFFTNTLFTKKPRPSHLSLLPHEFQTQELGLTRRRWRIWQEGFDTQTYPKGRMEFVELNSSYKNFLGLLEPKGRLEVVDPSQIDLIMFRA